ncbi:MAG: HAMP domain-containing histidine kinase [Lachnospiraceae bacterium]|nr:HAMP domain-containing histidine kinase [Lachnospiraceae bacterium]
MNYRLRLIISFSILISLAFGIGGALLISSSFYSALNKEQSVVLKEFENLQNNIAMVSHFSGDDYAFNIKEMVGQMEMGKMVRWQALSITGPGVVIIETGPSELLINNLKINTDGIYKYIRINDKTGKRLLFFSKINSAGKNLYLTASFDISSPYEHRDTQLKIFLAVYTVVVLTGVAVAALWVGVLTKRLQKLTEAVRKIADGDYSIRTSLKTGDEFEQLSMDIDAMTDKLQENIKQLEEDVKRKENFMGAVAHELKTPLTSIIGYSALLRQGNLEEDEQMTAANYIYSEGQRLEKLSHKLLDLLLMEKDSFVMKTVNLKTFSEQIYATVLPLAESKGVNLEFGFEEGNAVFEPDLTKSLLYNLIENAIKATPEGGKVTVLGKAFEGGCELSVKDTGYGMENKELSRITEAFYRVDKSRSRAQGGAGLGLTLCKKIADLHGGNMVFNSRPGEGCCVVVRLFGKLKGEVQHEE